MLRQFPLLDYRQYRQMESRFNSQSEALAAQLPASSLFRFTGEIESITDSLTLWVKGNNLTIPVSLEKTKCYLLPIHEGEGETPRQIRWDRVSMLSEGAKVYIGGWIKLQNNRLAFVSTKEDPLMVIFYNCPDYGLTDGIIRTARTRNEYWNGITPVSLAVGALALIYIAASFLDRPAFRLTVISAFIAVFIPILPVMPPGFIFTILHRRLTWSARKLRVNWDMVDFGFLPGSSIQLAVKAYALESFAWFLMLLGICINIIFIFLILSLFQVISF